MPTVFSEMNKNRDARCKKEGGIRDSTLAGNLKSGTHLSWSPIETSNEKTLLQDSSYLVGKNNGIPGELSRLPHKGLRRATMSR